MFNCLSVWSKAPRTSFGSWKVFHNLLVTHKSSLKCVKYNLIGYAKIKLVKLLIVLPLNNTFSDLRIDAFANFMFIFVDMSTVDMTISCVDCVLDSLSDSAGRWLEIKINSQLLCRSGKRRCCNYNWIDASFTIVVGSISVCILHNTTRTKISFTVYTSFIDLENRRFSCW